MRPIAIISASIVAVLASSACGDLLGVDEFAPPDAATPAPPDGDDVDAGGAGGAGGTAPVDEPSALAWWRTIGSDGHDASSSIATANGPVVAGLLAGVADLGLGMRGSAEQRQLFVLRLDEGGESLHDLVSSGSAEVGQAMVAAASGGTLVLAGSYRGGALDLDGTSLAAPSSGQTNLFWARLDQQLQVTISGVVASGDDVALLAAAVSDDDRVALAGIKRGALTASGLPELLGNVGDADGFVLQLGPTGAPNWAYDFRAPGDDADQSITALRYLGSELVVGGSFSRAVRLPDGSQRDSLGISDAFLVSLDAQGELAADMTFGSDSSTVTVRSIFSDDQGLLVTGGFTEALGLDDVTSRGDSDIFVMASSGVGQLDWARGYGGSGKDVSRAIVRSAESGEIFVAGSYSGIWRAAEEDRASVTSAGGRDALLLALDDLGEPLWMLGFGRQADDELAAMSLSASRISVVGHLRGGAILGDDQLEAHSDDDDALLAAFQR